MKKEVIAVFDIGKTNKKVFLFDYAFQVVYQHEEKFPVIKDDDGDECDDIDLITNWIFETLRQITGFEAYKLMGINFCTYGASLMFIDENGQRLTPLYDYLKTIPKSISEGLFSEFDGKAEFCRKTASPDLAFLLNSGIQILWLQNEKPQVFKNIMHILHLPQYLSFLLTHQIVAEPTSIGCHTFMWDFDKMQYHDWLQTNGIILPKPIKNNVVFPVKAFDQKVMVGTGIHDSSASLVPYLKTAKDKFILVSTGTWCINMNPFNDEPLTREQLARDCLCYLTPDLQQIKSSRLFMGHFHDVCTQKLSEYFNVEIDHYKTMEVNQGLQNELMERFETSAYFPDGKDTFESGIKSIGLAVFSSYEEAYSKLMIDLTDLCYESINLILPEKDNTEIIYVSGGFSRNPLFIWALKNKFRNKHIQVSEIDNSSALGAAMVIGDVFSGAKAGNKNFDVF